MHEFLLLILLPQSVPSQPLPNERQQNALEIVYEKKRNKNSEIHHHQINTTHVSKENLKKRQYSSVETYIRVKVPP